MTCNSRTLKIMTSDAPALTRQQAQASRGAGTMNLIARRPELTGAIALLMLYIAVLSGRVYSTDGALMFRQAESIVYEQSLRFSIPISERAPHITSRYGIGQTLLYLPGVYIYSLANPDNGHTAMRPWDPHKFYNYEAYRYAGAAVNALITVLTVYLVARFVMALGFSRRAALWSMALYGIGSPAIAYVRSDFSQPLEALCWIAAVYWAFKYSRSGRLADALIAALAVGYAVLTRPVEGVLIALIAAFLVVPGLAIHRWGRRGWQGFLAVSSGFGVGVIITLLINWGRFGSPWVSGYEGEGWTWDLLTGVPGALISPGRGILWQFPAIVLAPLGARLLWRSGYGKLVLAIVGLVTLQFLNVTGWWMWWGGWNWGLRLFLPALPLVAVLAGCGIASLGRRAVRWIPSLLLIIGVIWAVPCIISDISGGYARAYNTAASNFRLESYPPIGAWAYFDHWLPQGDVDSRAADILWLRLAPATGNASLIVPLMLIAGAALLWCLLVSMIRRLVEANSSEPDRAVT